MHISTLYKSRNYYLSLRYVLASMLLFCGVFGRAQSSTTDSVQLSVQAPGAQDVQWFIIDATTGTQTAIAGATDTTLVTDSVGIYYATYDSGNRCAEATTYAYVACVSTLDQGGLELEAGEAPVSNVRYQWYKDGMALVNDTMMVLSVTEEGEYGVDIIGEGCPLKRTLIDVQAINCVEDCANFLDDDGDGYEDFFDPDCPDYNPFECSVSDIYLVADNGPNTGLYRVSLLSGDTTEITNQIGSPGGDIINLNISVGISPKDNFMYGLFRSILFRIDASGRALFVGNVSGAGFDPTSRYNNATFGPDGTFYVSNQSPTRNVYAIDVDPLSPTYLEATLINSTTVATSDIAFNPADGQIYSVTAAEELLQFDPSTGTETNLGVVAGLADVGYNATFMVGERTLMAFANGGALYRIDIDELTAELDLASGPNLTGTSDRSDGASNAFCLSLLKDAVDTVQFGDTVTYTFSLNNRTGDTILNAVFIDALPSGAVYASGAQNASAGLVIENTDLSGLTDARLGISSIDTGLHTFTLDVVVTSCDAVGETLLNQALVDSFQTSMVFSDDPSTGRLADSTSVFIIDTVGVQLVCPTDTTLYGCDTSVANATNYPVTPAIIGGCGVDSLWNMDEILGLACGDSIVRTWFVLDSLGNVDSCTQSIVVRDTTSPSFDIMPDTTTLTVTCASIPAAPALTASDVCGVERIFIDEIQFDVNCWTDYKIRRDMWAVDSCGNSTDTFTQIIVVIDTTPPTFDSLPADTLFVQRCIDTVPETLNYTASEECLTDISRQLSFTSFQNGYIVDLNQALEDAASGCSATGIYDSDCDGFGTIVSGALVADYLLDASLAPVDPMVADFFAGVTFDIITESNVGAGDRIVGSTTFNRVGLDMFGSTAFEVVFSAPVIYMLNGAPQTRPLDNVQFSGDFERLVPYAPVNATFDDPNMITQLTGPQIGYQSLRETGNIASTRKIIGGEGTNFKVASERNLQQWFEAYVYIQPDTTLMSFEADTMMGTCAGDMMITRRWIASDSCGNADTATQVVIVRDTMAPMVSCIGMDTVYLDASGKAALDVATLYTSVSDNCGVDSIWVDRDSFDCDDQPTGFAPSQVVTLSVMDSCGNVSTCEIDIIVLDTIAPIITCLNIDTTLYGCADPSLADDLLALMPVSMDNCIADSMSTGLSMVDDSCGLTLIRSITVSDRGANASNQCVDTIRIRDTMAPMINCLFTDTVLYACDITDIDLSMLGMPVASDSCGIDSMWSEDVEFLTNCVDSVIRTWMVRDSCGNMASCAQTIVVRDTTSPELICGADTVLYACDITDIDLSTLGMPVASDSCGVDSLWSEDVEFLTNCVDSVVRTWMVRDSCGNMASCTQTIVVRDTTSPIITCPSDTVLSGCTVVSTDTSVLGVAIASDDCDVDSLWFADRVDSLPGSVTIARWWYAIDGCGNVDSCQQTIEIRSSAELDVNVFLEGAYDISSGEMTTTLNAYRLLPGQDPNLSTDFLSQLLGVPTPAGQPYSVAPWNHLGAEGDLFGDPATNPVVGRVPYDGRVVDWVLVSIRENGFLAANTVWTCAGLLYADGAVEFPQGCDCLGLTPGDTYHIVVEHRSHLPALSEEIMGTGSTLAYDFRVQEGFSPSIGSPQQVNQKQLVPGTYALLSGNYGQASLPSDRVDINSDDDIRLQLTFGSVRQYSSADGNMDGDVNSSDRVNHIFVNFGFFNFVF